ncbi:MAG: hypothetical protein ACXVCP_18785 [Bdellovibrio sp.]
MTLKIIALLTLTIWNLSANAATPLDNQILSFAGTNSAHGPYKGQLEIRSDKNGELTATRIMTYDTFKFQNLNIQEVWTGHVTYYPARQVYLISYELKRADFLKSADGQSRSDDDFKKKNYIFQNVLLDANSIASAKFERTGEVFSETITGKSNAALLPLWENKRYRMESVSHESSTLMNIAGGLMKLRVFDWYHDQPLPRSYSYRKEYRAKQQFITYDPTDLDFYRANPQILRVVNKTPDFISLVEDVQRRNAYAPTLNQKAEHFDSTMQAYHLNEYGMYSGALFSPDGTFQKYMIDGDSGLWTGMYLASQAMRYSVTKEEAALVNLKKALNGLMLLMDITGDPKEFARTVGKYEEGMTLPDYQHRGQNENQDKIWQSKGNNDMFKGIVHGFISAYLALPQTETELRTKLLNHMARMPDLSVADNSSTNKSLAYGLRALATGSKDDRKTYTNNFSKNSILESALSIEGKMHIGGIADWSGVNLTMVGTLSNILIAQALGEKEVLKDGRKELMMIWKDMVSTKRDFLTIAAYAFAVKEGFNVPDVNELNDDYSDQGLQQAWNKELTNSVWSLREIPINRSSFSVSFDHSLNPDWCLSWWPRMPWKSITDRKPVDFHYQSVDGYPLFETSGMGGDFIWNSSAFEYKGEFNGSVKYTGVDYLYTYWMGRYSGLIKQLD